MQNVEVTPSPTDGPETSQSRDLSVVSSRCSAQTFWPRLDLDLSGLEPKTNFYKIFPGDGLSLRPALMN